MDWNSHHKCPDSIDGPTQPEASHTLLAFLAHIRVVNNNQITGAGAGICAIKDLFYPDWCSLSANPDWTNGAMCPACLNTGNCKPPVTCTNTSF